MANTTHKDENDNEKHSQDDILNELLSEMKKMTGSSQKHDKSETIVVTPDGDEQGLGSVVFEKNQFNQMIYNKVIRSEAMLNEMMERWLLINPVLSEVKKVLGSFEKLNSIENDVSSIKNDMMELKDKMKTQSAIESDIMAIKNDVTALKERQKSQKSFTELLKEKSEFSEYITKVLKFIFYVVGAVYLLINVLPQIGSILKLIGGGN